MAKDTKKKRKGNAGAEGEKYAICLEGVNKAYEDGVPALTDINLMFKDNQDFVTQIKGELFADKIYIYTSNGRVIELPKGSNIIDFACYSGIEHILVGAKVNDELVPLDYELKNKDRVISLVDELSFGYRSDWIDKANTSFAKKKLMRLG